MAGVAEKGRGLRVEMADGDHGRLGEQKRLAWLDGIGLMLQTDSEQAGRQVSVFHGS